MSDIVVNGLTLMVLGMGIVFLFLGTMVLTTEWCSRAAARFAHLLPEPEPARKPSARPPASAPAAAPDSAAADDELLAVIGAAVHRYRTENC